MQKQRGYIRLGFALLACWLVAGVLAAQEKEKDRDHYSIDLKTIGYPEPIDDFTWDGSLYFLDSERLLVTFPTEKPDPDGAKRDNPYHFRSVVIDFSGKALHSLDHHGDVVAGPDGHILQNAETEVRILDSDFSLLQTVPGADFVAVVPGKTGFITGNGEGSHLVYYSGTPARKTQEANNFCNAVSVQGGFVCVDGKDPAHSVVHVDANAPHPDLRSENTIERPGLEENPDKEWLYPGKPAVVDWYRKSISTSGRAMYTTWGTLHPLDERGIRGSGHFLRVLVIDIKTKRTILRQQYGKHDEVDLSPDGKWFAVREGRSLNLRKLPE